MRSRDKPAGALEHAIDRMQRDPSDGADDLVFVDARTAVLIRHLHALARAVVPRAEFCRALEERLLAEAGGARSLLHPDVRAGQRPHRFPTALGHLLPCRFHGISPASGCNVGDSAQAGQGVSRISRIVHSKCRRSP